MDHLRAIGRIVWNGLKQSCSMRIALATGLYAFHRRVVLVQEARCEVGDDWMIALYDVDEASERCHSGRCSAIPIFVGFHSVSPTNM